MNWLRQSATWLLAHAASIIFTLGLASIAYGFAMWDTALAFIVPGCIVCTLTAIPPLVSFFRGGN